MPVAMPVAMTRLQFSLLAVAIAAALWYVMARRRYVPSRRLALIVLAASPLWLATRWAWGAWAAAAMVVVVVVAVLLDYVLVPGRGSFEVAREAPPSLGLGDEPSEGRYRVRSAAPATVRGALHDAMPAEIERGGDLAPTFRLTSGDEAELPFTLVGRTRGRYALGPVVLEAVGPLGLVRRFFRYDLDDGVTVAPSIAAVRTFRLLALQHRLRDAGLRVLRRRGAGTSFAGLREYVVGDDPRHVDWKASARRDALVTREFTVEQGQTVLIAVDAGRMMTQLAGADQAHPVPRFEYALSAALVLADVAIHSGDSVGLLLFDDEVRAFVPPTRGGAALRAMREALIPAQATMAEPDYAAAFRTLATRHRKRSLFVIFTDVIDVRASQALIAHAARGAARHLPLVVALRNDALVAAAAPPPDDAALTTEQLFERAAAEELLSAREAALHAMRQAGVSVVDVSPTAMTAAVVNRYLELKGRGAV